MLSAQEIAERVAMAKAGRDLIGRLAASELAAHYRRVLGMPAMKGE